MEVIEYAYLMKIRNQLFFIFLILGISASILVSLLIYFQGKKIILRQIVANLEAVSQTKEIRLNNMIERKYETLDLIASTPLLINEVAFLTEKKDKKAPIILDSILNHYKSVLRDVIRIYITNQDGIVISSSDNSYIGKNLSEKESFITVKNKGKYLNGFFYNRPNELALTGGTTIYNWKKNKINGILLADIEAEDVLTVTSDYTGLGATGETVIAKKYLNNTVFLTPTRFNPKAALTLQLPDDSSYAMDLALQGKEGLFTDLLDYRNEKVIASARFIKDGEWGLLTKIDKKEAYASIDMLRNFLLLFNIVFIGIAFVTSYLIGRYLAKPVEELTASTNKIREGELDSRVKEYPKNELGVLAESFNNMADNLENKINDLNKVGFVISHDLRAPLNNIIPLIHFIKEDSKGKLNTETMQMMDMIEAKAIQMNELIVEILETARTQHKVKETINTQVLVNTIVNDLRPPAHIEIFIQPNLPFVLYHKVSLIQVFQNLIENAIKYMDKKSGKIKIGYSEEDNYYKFCIRDNGPGIKKKDLERVFQMFESSNTRSDIESTGIGLGVAKKIVEDNGGQIWVESEPGEGSGFYFTIPKS